MSDDHCLVAPATAAVGDEAEPRPADHTTDASMAAGPPRATRVLLLHEAHEGARALSDALLRGGFQVVHTTSRESALRCLASGQYHALIADLSGPGIDGPALSLGVSALYPRLPILVLVAPGDVSTGLAAVRAGAYALLSKPLDVAVLQLALERAIDHMTLRDRSAPPSPVHDGDGTIGAQAAIRAASSRPPPSVDDLALAARLERMGAAPSETPGAEAWPTLHELEQHYVMRVLDAVHGNRSRAAVLLGVDRRTLYRMLSRYGVDLRAPRATPHPLGQ